MRKGVRCDVRCWRIGASAEYVDGVCNECGAPEPDAPTEPSPGVEPSTDEELRIVAEVYAKLPEPLRATTILGGLTATRDVAARLTTELDAARRECEDMKRRVEALAVRYEENRRGDRLYGGTGMAGQLRELLKGEA